VAAVLRVAVVEQALAILKSVSKELAGFDPAALQLAEGDALDTLDLQDLVSGVIARFLVMQLKKNSQDP
jgi:hypothetical protein